LATGSTELIEVDLSLLAQQPVMKSENLWAKTDLGVVQDKIRQQIAPHAAKLYRLRPA